MISVEEAKNRILGNCNKGPAKLVRLQEAIGCVLSGKIRSPMQLPPFDQSSKDGYAFNYSDCFQNQSLQVIGEVVAGAALNRKIKPGEAVRIFTGARLPAGADTVIMQEYANRNENELLLKGPELFRGAHVIKEGSQLKKGDLAFEAGTVLRPGGIGLLAVLGISKVSIFSRPRLSLIVTGNELEQAGKIAGKKLKSGKIYDANSGMLAAAVRAMGMELQSTVFVKDQASSTQKALRNALGHSDFVLISGGISVGDYDCVEGALNKTGVKTLFYKVSQKPGKPLCFGKKGKTLVFALPGNPAAALTCFYEYVYPALRKFQGQRDCFLKNVQLPIETDYAKSSELSYFLKGKLNEKGVLPLEGQDSSVLKSFSTADALIYLPQGIEKIKKGSLTEVHLLPYV